MTPPRQPATSPAMLVGVGWDEMSWSGGRRVRYARAGDALFLRLSEVTSQSRVYKKCLDAFFRHELRDWRPRWGDFEVEIEVRVAPGLPKIDLDNVAKAILDGIKGAVFFDDAQVSRLLVHRAPAEVEAIYVTVRPAPRPAET